MAGNETRRGMETTPKQVNTTEIFFLPLVYMTICTCDGSAGNRAWLLRVSCPGTCVSLALSLTQGDKGKGPTIPPREYRRGGGGGADKALDTTPRKV